MSNVPMDGARVIRMDRALPNNGRPTTAGSRGTPGGGRRREMKSAPPIANLGMGRPRSPPEGRARPNSSPGKQNGRRPPAVLNMTDADENDTANEDDAEETFGEAMQALDRAHQNQIAELNTEITELKARLHAVLTSTWNFTDESWTGNPKNAKMGILELSSTNMGKKKKTLMEVSPEDQGNMAATSDHVKIKFKPLVRWSLDRDDMQEAEEEEEDDEEELPQENEEDLLQVIQGDGCMRHFMLPPFGNKRMIFDVFGMILLMYDVVTVPLSAYDFADTLFTQMMDYFTLLFWSFDMFLSFFTGYVDNGRLVLEPRAVAKNYLSSRFLLDFIVVGPDWGFTIMLVAGASGEKGGGSSLLQLARVFRLARISRVLRMKKFRRMWLRFKDRVDSENVFLVPTIVQAITITLIACHFLAAGWYVVGNLTRLAGSPNWLEAADPDVYTSAPGYRFLTSLQWMVGKFCLASVGRVSPQNEAERAYAIFAQLVGGVMFWWSISSITVCLLDLRHLNSQTSQEIWLLRRYMKQHHVPQELSLRILAYSESTCRKQIELVPESKITLLSFLSEQLFSELKCHAKFASIFRHPLLENVGKRQSVVQGLVNSALARKACSAGDIICTAKGLSRQMMIVSSGQLRYFRIGTGQMITLQTHDWMCEQALWMSWAYKGNAQSLRECLLVTIDSRKFGEVIEGDPMTWKMMAKYAKKYVTELNRKDRFEISDVEIGEEGRDRVRKRIHDAARTRVRESMTSVHSIKPPNHDSPEQPFVSPKKLR